ncbi:ATP-dependent helicase [Butyricicoccus pullicaecorum]|uniref:ATP-dependent helicase n=1 Tax=Butyricicoccus pullicaecorum TaxID=501571 RepID=UPI0035209EEC
MEPTKFDIKFASVRKAVIEQVFSRMNDRQREAVFQTEGPLLVLAGAGSGKTTVLIHRIINILRFGHGYDSPYATPGATMEDLAFLADYMANPKPENQARAMELCAVSPAKPWEVVAITFTNKAARELQDRLTRAVGEADASAIWAYTFHTCCLRILRRDIERLGYNRTFTIYDEDDKKRVITDLIRRLKLDEKIFDARKVMGEISRAKDNLITPRTFALEQRSEFYMGRIADLYTLYEKEMRENNALDFDDIIMKTVQLLQDNPDILEHYQRKFRYVLVDEYQDTNHAQYVLTSLLAGGYQNICVVGDDDQSIYKFRGATITNILEFEKQFKNARAIRLEQNYRSTNTILDAANGLIRNNVNRKGKELWTKQEGGSKIKLHRSDTQESEAQYIAARILEGVAKGCKWSDFAILYRNNVLSNAVESAFRRNSIPYRIYKGRDFFSRAEIRDMFAYLWVIENPSDTLRLKRIINVPARKIGARSVEIAEELAAQHNTMLYDIVSHADAYSELGRGATAMKRFGDMMQELRDMQQTASLSELYDTMLDLSGYQEALENKNDMESRSRLENIMELKSNIVEYENKAEDPSLAGFLEEMALYTDADQDEEEDDTVLMMTMHSAKGLEFPTVFLCGMEDGLFPSFRADESDEDLEEERRLCYVAITRAKQQLYLTCAERRLMYGQTRYARPSRFLQEIPAELLDSNLTERARQAEAEQAQKKAYRPRSTVNQSYRSASALQSSMTTSSVPTFACGDRVMHKAFGEGMITSVKPMGGDQLLEIAFTSKGTKRLMAKSASQFMHKI